MTMMGSRSKDLSIAQSRKLNVSDEMPLKRTYLLLSYLYLYDFELLPHDTIQNVDVTKTTTTTTTTTSIVSRAVLFMDGWTIHVRDLCNDRFGIR